MEYQEFIRRVQEQAGLDSPERAEEVTRATLETLGERLERKVKDGVAAQLPGELKTFLLQRDQDSIGYELQEFYNRVGARAGTKLYEAAENAKAVVAVLKQAVSEGEIQNLRSGLPQDYRGLFDPQTRGPGFPSLDRSG